MVPGQSVGAFASVLIQTAANESDSVAESDEHTTSDLNDKKTG